MSNVVAHAKLVTIEFTVREFNLVTKALAGTLDPKIKPFGSINKVGTANSAGDIPEARYLAQRLIEQRAQSMEKQLQSVHDALKVVEERHATLKDEIVSIRESRPEEYEYVYDYEETK